MPNIPNINPQVSGPSVGSVGRMSINAPVEAFGGGRAASGLAQVGRGLQGIGQGVQDISAGSQQRGGDAAKAEAARNAKLQKLSDDRVVLEYDKETQALKNTLKTTRTSGAGQPRKTDLYSEQAQKIREKLLKEKKDPAEREALLLRMERSDLERMNALASAQATEDLQFNADTRKAQAGNVINTMRENHESLNKDNVVDWFNQQNSSAIEYGSGLLADGTPRELAQQEVNKQRQSGFKGAIEEKMTAISRSTVPTTAGQDIKSILEQVPDTIMTKKEKEEYSKQIDTLSKARVESLSGQALAAKNEQINVFTSSLVNMDNDYDRDAEHAKFVTQNPDLKNEADIIFNKYKMQTPLSTEIAISKELSETANPETFRSSLIERLKSGEISATTYNDYMTKSQKAMDDKKNRVWNNMLLRIQSIQDGIEEGTGGKGEFKRTGGFDIKANKEMLDAVKNLNGLVYDNNVTYLEVKQVMDDILFKPESKMLAMKLEKRVFEGTKMLLRAAEEPGTQDLKEEDIELYTKKRLRSTEDLKAEQYIMEERIYNKHKESLSPKNREVQEQLEKGL